MSDLVDLLRGGPYLRDGSKTVRFMCEAADEIERLRAALAKAKAKPEAIFTMAQFGGLVGLAREHARERAVVYRATDCRGDTCHFGVKSAAVAWANSGTVEEVPVRDLRVVSAPQPAALASVKGAA